MSAFKIVVLALNLHAYDFVSQEICAMKDPEFEVFCPRGILLNKGIRALKEAQDHPHQNLILLKDALPCGKAFYYFSPSSYIDNVAFLIVCKDNFAFHTQT